MVEGFRQAQAEYEARLFDPYSYYYGNDYEEEYDSSDDDYERLQDRLRDEKNKHI